MTTAQLIVDFPERNPDLMYATRFAAPDACIFFEHRGKKFLVLSDLEIDRGRAQANVDHVLALADFVRKARTRFGNARQIDVLDTICREYRIRQLLVPPTMAAALVDDLRKRQYKVTLGETPFYPQRLIKTPAETRAIHAAQQIVFRAFRRAEEILRASAIRRDTLYYRGKILTSEWMRAEMAYLFTQADYATPDGMIVACGEQSTAPHDHGHGPLRPHRSIIVDLFPRSNATFFFGDSTRTFCRGKAPPALKKMYAAVSKGQAIGIQLIRAGVNGKTVHTAITKYFETLGYRTGNIDGRMQGFFHSTGHGIGLELHEIPQRISAQDYTLRAGHVFSVEPGLYYIDTGGVRIEDLVVITTTGCRVLGGPYPRRLEIL